MMVKKRRIEFSLSAPEAQEVYLAGNFNNWSQISDSMKQSSGGMWKKTKMLPQGQHEYKFVVDGAWTHDPRCAETVPNACGTYNSRIKL